MTLPEGRLVDVGGLRRHTRAGIITDAIIAVPNELNPELIIMPIQGRHEFLDALRGQVRPSKFCAKPADR